MTNESLPEPDLLRRPIRELGLTIAGSRLEPIVETFLDELRGVGLEKIAPRIYLSTEWGVPSGTRAIAVPFYLVREDLTALQAERAGHVEGRNPADILRYLRHEMGHVVNYVYRLFETAEWEALFGPMSLPYREEYRPIPFSRDFVRHLPGWYAQKHPDEDWAETFAVRISPGHDWRREYADWPVALAKLEYCDRILNEVAGTEPPDSSDELDVDVSEIAESLNEFYPAAGRIDPEVAGLDSALLTLFEDADEPSLAFRSASTLIDLHAREIATDVYRWTGRFPEWTLPVLRHLAQRASALNRAYKAGEEARVLIGLTAFVTSLAIHHGDPRTEST